MNEELDKTVRDLSGMDRPALIAFLRELVGSPQMLPPEESLENMPLEKLRDATLRIVLDRNTNLFCDPYITGG